MPPKSWLKQNAPPPTGVPAGVAATPHVVTTWLSPRPMNMYSALTLQLPANAHSRPPPSVPVAKLLESVVATSQLPHPMAVVLQASAIEASARRNAAPPLT